MFLKLESGKGGLYFEIRLCADARALWRCGRVALCAGDGVSDRGPGARVQPAI